MKSEAIRAELNELKVKLTGQNLSHAEREDIMLRIKDLEMMEATAVKAEAITNGAFRFLNGESKDTEPSIKPYKKPPGLSPSNK